MAKWTHNGPCRECGSRDNLAHYDDGSTWCWGCHAHSGKTKLVLEDEDEPKQHRALPDDFGTWFGPDSVSWFSSYGFSVPQLIERNVGFSPRYNQTIFTFPPTGLWQARNHWSNKVKYFTSGNHVDILPIYYCGARGKSLVVTEDCLSSIKVAALSDSMPLLGAHLHLQKLTSLKRFYEELTVWLDHDKAKEATKIADQAKMLGMKARVVSTELDPKEYEYEDIEATIRGS